MASSMLEPAAVAMKVAAAAARAATEAETSAETDAEEEEEENEHKTNAINKNNNNNNNNNNENEKNEEDASTSTSHMCANEPDFAVICAFFEKFSKDLGMDLPNFKHLQEWIINTDEVVPQLRDLHIKLLRKARKTVHDKNWESQLSKYCFAYSAQDAWEVERFGYKKSSLKVKLRVLLILLESQFERNVKFRANCVTMSGDSLRGQPIGRDRLGHAYYLTQDDDCNLRIYQEHLDEEIWQVVATNREEFVNLIARLRGNEVVLPSTDIGVVDEDSSSNSCTAVVPKPPPPVEQDDSQEEECAKVPTMRIKFNAASGQSCVTNELKKTKRDTEAEVVAKHAEIEDKKNDSIEEINKKEKDDDKLSGRENRRKVKPIIITPTKAFSATTPKKRLIEDVDISPTHNAQQAYKKSRPSLLQSKRISQKDERDEEEEDGEEIDGEEDDVEEEEEDFDSEGEDIDSAAADEGDDEDKDIEDNDDDDDDDDDDEDGDYDSEDGNCGVGKPIKEPTYIVRGQGSGRDCQAANPLHEIEVDSYENGVEVEEAIEEQVLYVTGEGSGRDCMVGNTGKNEMAESSKKTTEPKATFFFGEPGCLKLSPTKKTDESPVKKFSLFGSWLAENKEQKTSEIEMQNVNDEKQDDGNEKTQEIAEVPKPAVEPEIVNENAVCENEEKIANMKIDSKDTSDKNAVKESPELMQNNDKVLENTNVNGDTTSVDGTITTDAHAAFDEIESSSGETKQTIEEIVHSKIKDTKLEDKMEADLDSEPIEQPQLCDDKIEIEPKLDTETIQQSKICEDEIQETVELKPLEQSELCEDKIPAKVEIEPKLNTDTKEQYKISDDEMVADLDAETIEQPEISEVQIQATVEIEPKLHTETIEQSNICEDKREADLDSEPIKQPEISEDQIHATVEIEPKSDTETIEQSNICEDKREADLDSEPIEQPEICDDKIPAKFEIEHKLDKISDDEMVANLDAEIIEPPEISEDQIQATVEIEPKLDTDTKEQSNICEDKREADLDSEPIEQPEICDDKIPAKVEIEHKLDKISDDEMEANFDAEMIKPPEISEDKMEDDLNSETIAHSEICEDEIPAKVENEPLEQSEVREDKLPANVESKPLEQSEICGEEIKGDLHNERKEQPEINEDKMEPDSDSETIKLPEICEDNIKATFAIERTEKSETIAQPEICEQKLNTLCGEKTKSKLEALEDSEICNDQIEKKFNNETIEEPEIFCKQTKAKVDSELMINPEKCNDKMSAKFDNEANDDSEASGNKNEINPYEDRNFPSDITMTEEETVYVGEHKPDIPNKESDDSIIETSEIKLAADEMQTEEVIENKQNSPIHIENELEEQPNDIPSMMTLSPKEDEYMMDPIENQNTIDSESIPIVIENTTVVKENSISVVEGEEEAAGSEKSYDEAMEEPTMKRKFEAESTKDEKINDHETEPCVLNEYDAEQNKIQEPVIKQNPVNEQEPVKDQEAIIMQTEVNRDEENITDKDSISADISRTCENEELQMESSENKIGELPKDQELLENDRENCKNFGEVQNVDVLTDEPTSHNQITIESKEDTEYFHNSATVPEVKYSSQEPIPETTLSSATDYQETTNTENVGESSTITQLELDESREQLLSDKTTIQLESNFEISEQNTNTEAKSQTVECDITSPKVAVGAIVEKPLSPTAIDGDDGSEIGILPIQENIVKSPENIILSLAEKSDDKYNERDNTVEDISPEVELNPDQTEIQEKLPTNIDSTDVVDECCDRDKQNKLEKFIETSVNLENVVEALDLELSTKETSIQPPESKSTHVEMLEKSEDFDEIETSLESNENIEAKPLDYKISISVTQPECEESKLTPVEIMQEQQPFQSIETSCEANGNNDEKVIDSKENITQVDIIEEQEPSKDIIGVANTERKIAISDHNFAPLDIMEEPKTFADMQTFESAENIDDVTIDLELSATALSFQPQSYERKLTPLQFTEGIENTAENPRIETTDQCISQNEDMIPVEKNSEKLSSQDSDLVLKSAEEEDVNPEQTTLDPSCDAGETILQDTAIELHEHKVANLEENKLIETNDLVKPQEHEIQLFESPSQEISTKKDSDVVSKSAVEEAANPLQTSLDHSRDSDETLLRDDAVDCSEVNEHKVEKSELNKPIGVNNLIKSQEQDVCVAEASIEELDSKNTFVVLSSEEKADDWPFQKTFGTSFDSDETMLRETPVDFGEEIDEKVKNTSIEGTEVQVVPAPIEVPTDSGEVTEQKVEYAVEPVDEICTEKVDICLKSPNKVPTSFEPADDNDNYSNIDSISACIPKSNDSTEKDTPNSSTNLVNSLEEEIQPVEVPTEGLIPTDINIPLKSSEEENKPSIENNDSSDLKQEYCRNNYIESVEEFKTVVPKIDVIEADTRIELKSSENTLEKNSEEDACFELPVSDIKFGALSEPFKDSEAPLVTKINVIVADTSIELKSSENTLQENSEKDACIKLPDSDIKLGALSEPFSDSEAPAECNQPNDTTIHIQAQPKLVEFLHETVSDLPVARDPDPASNENDLEPISTNEDDNSNNNDFSYDSDDRSMGYEPNEEDSCEKTPVNEAEPEPQPQEDPFQMLMQTKNDIDFKSDNPVTTTIVEKSHTTPSFEATVISDNEGANKSEHCEYQTLQQISPTIQQNTAQEEIRPVDKNLSTSTDIAVIEDNTEHIAECFPIPTNEQDNSSQSVDVSNLKSAMAVMTPSAQQIEECSLLPTNLQDKPLLMPKVAPSEKTLPAYETYNAIQETNPSGPLDLAFNSMIKGSAEIDNISSTALNLSATSTVVKNKYPDVRLYGNSVTQPTLYPLAQHGETNEVPLASIPTKEIIPTEPCARTFPNRKRRVAQTFSRTQSTSESEINLHSEQLEQTVDSDFDEEVGGKRIKMRSKQTNIELRKKYEAQKIPTDEATSSSGEEEARRRRKIISPKRNPKNPSSFFKSQDCDTSLEATSSKISRPSISDINVCSTADKVPEIAKQPSTIKPVGSKQKPTLAEIIEKKLKKSILTTQVNVTTTDTAESSTESVIPKTSPPKKMPITKPLKKNLLTQLRLDSDDEPIPRKRTLSEIMAESAYINKEPIKPELDEPPIVQNIATNILRQETPERIIPEKQRKRRSSDEVRSCGETAVAQDDDASDVVGEKHKRNNDHEPAEIAAKTTSSQAVFEEISAQKVCEVKEPEATTPELPVGRRSGRRGKAAVVYSELPQVKRTRGAAKDKKETNTSKIAQIADVPVVKDGTPPNKKETKNTKNEIKQDKPIPHAEANEIEMKENKPEPKDDTEKVVKEEEEKPDEPKEGKIENENEISIKSESITKKDNEIANEVEEVPKEKSPAPVSVPANNETPTSASSTCTGRGRGARKKREVDTSNIIEATDSETPVRQSRRIAQLKIREEAERRKLEEIALRNMKQEFKKKKKAETDFDPAVVEPSEHSSSEESAVESKRKVKKKCPGKDGWSSGSEEQEEPEEEEEPPHYETDPGSPLFRSDHEFSPESDLEDESQVVPMKRARTARKEDADEDEKADEQACQNCGKSDHPEWILLCDKCDRGYHCSCLSPVLFYIPEGDWYCPPCQQAELILALEQRLNIFDGIIEQKRLAAEEVKRVAQEAELAEKVRLLEEEKMRKERREHKNNRNSSDSSDEGDEENRKVTKQHDSKESGSEDDEKSLAKLKKSRGADKSKRRRADAKNRNRRAARRGNRRRNRHLSGSQDESESGSGDSRAAANSSKSSSSDSSAATDSDDEPIYKLRKRRQINVSYRLNEYDEIINSALKKEMNEVAGAGNSGRGKDITTIIEADKEEKARLKHSDDNDDEPDENEVESEVKEEKEKDSVEDDKEETPLVENKPETKEKAEVKDDSDSDEALIIRRKPKVKSKSKKSRKLTTLDISSEEDHASDEDFKTNSMDDEEEDEDTTFSGSSESDSSLEIYKRKTGKRKERRRAARERRKDRKFIYDESEDEDDKPIVKTKKKRKVDTDYEESEDEDEDASENSENLDSADLCDDTTSESSDGAWKPSNKNKKKKRKSNTIARKSPKLKKPVVVKKKKRETEYSDDDISESEEDEDDDYYNGVSGKGSGKQPRSQPLKTSAKTSSKESNKGVGKGKGKGKGKTPSGKSENKHSGDESYSDSGDSARRTRGRRYAYLEDFDDDSSDGGIKPGVKRPDTPPEEREKFIKRQEEIKRMLAEKNAEGAKLAATPRLTPIKGTTADKRTPGKAGDSLSTVPLSVIRQAKVLDKDYLQRVGEPIGELETANADEEVDAPEFDDADLPYDFPEDMDEDAIARMVDEDDFASASRELPPADEVVRSSTKSRSKTSSAASALAAAAAAAEMEKANIPSASASLAAMAQIPSISTSGLQEPVRKRLPMPTMHPPLLRHQPVSVAAMHHNLSAAAVAAAAAQILTRHPTPPSYLLQSALTSPMGQPLNRHFAQPPRGMPQMPPHLAARPPSAHAQMAQSAEAEPKPRGRRKKITPLRDALQKQQTAAASSTASSSTVPTSAITTTTAQQKSNSRSQMPPTSIPVGGVIKSAMSSSINPSTSTSSTSLSVAQPPQLYKRAGEIPPDEQPSVITRMPLLGPHVSTTPTSSRHQHSRPPVSVAGQLAPSSIFQSVADARFYAPPQNLPHGARSLPSSMVTQRMPRGAHHGPGGMPLQLSGLPPHHSMRPTYGPPPPLRGCAGGPLPNHGQPPTTGAAGVTRSPYASVTQAGDSPGGHGTYAVPPPARHATAHLNPYRPTIYGNPNFAPRAPFAGSNLRHAGPPGGPDYAAGARPYPPYGYYPPPPPLTAPSQQHSSSQSSSSGGAALPSALPSSVIVSAPPSAERVGVISRSSSVKSPSTTPHNHKQPSVLVDSRRKLTTLDVYSTTKSPLTMGGESSGSRSSPGGEEVQATPVAHSTVIAASGDAGAESKASEFSGLVSYFSSQHDDYNT